MWFLDVSELRLVLHRLAAVLLVLWWLGMAFVPGAAAQGSGSDLTGTIVFLTVSGGPIYAVEADTLAGTGGGNLRYLTTGIDPALSPQGDRVAFTRWDNGQHGALGSLWVMNVGGSGERLILDGMSQPKSPVWSPDGTRVVINVQQGGRLWPWYGRITPMCRPPSSGGPGHHPFRVETGVRIPLGALTYRTVGGCRM